ncbi:hypothetical protein H5410_022322 [Solanum commersonii]|uniref:Uncharacterized protein n=1 Tax=Solanum commersonii TaxID=4109 RepID=A0A9J5ZDV6_SOLCO|nr:hypothetical protein H5410_022322 [Solanum commersonii]
MHMNKLNKSIKHGDSLSLALFILTAGVLSRDRNVVFEDDLYVGYGLSKWTTNINSVPIHALSAIVPLNCVIKEFHRSFAKFFGVTKLEEKVNTGLLKTKFVYLSKKED